MKNIFCILIFFPLFCFGLEVPQLTSPVMDLSGILSIEDKDSLSLKIKDYFNKSTNQISVLIVPSLDGEILEEYSIKVASKWGLGDKEKDNGILLLFSISDRKYRIEVGQGLEGYLTDVESSRIQREIKPFLKQSKYFEAINQEIDLIIKVITKNSDPEVLAQKQIEEKKQQEMIERQKQIFLSSLYYIFSFLLLAHSIFVWYSYFVFPKKIRNKKLKMLSLKRINKEKEENNNKIQKQYESLVKKYRGSKHWTLKNAKDHQKDLLREIDKIDKEILRIKNIARKNGENI